MELNERFADRGVSFVSIDMGRRQPAVEKYLDELEVRHLVLNDESRDAADKYRVRGIPLTVLVDHEGRVMYRHLGFREGDEETFAMEIEALLSWRDTPT